MRPVWLISIAFSLLAVTNLISELEPFIVSTNQMSDLNGTLERHLERTKFPAIAAAVVKGTNIVAAGVVGVRKAGETNQATLHDKFHIGSCTKSITALLALLLEKEGKMKLTSRVGDVLSDWEIPKEAAEIRLKQLLQNRSGLGNQPDRNLWAKAFEARGAPQEQRRSFLTAFLEEPLEAEPGTRYIYSNIGYSLAGAMLERVAGKSWEELVREEIFKPRGLSSAGFGPPTTSRSKLDEPWGHTWRDDLAEPARPHDNPVAIAPGGAVHMSILDMARYVAFHLAGARGETGDLDLSALYEPAEGEDYALGWVVTKRKWAGGKTLTHTGSNTMFFTVIWMAPAKNMAWIVSTNVGDREDHVAKECDKVVAELIKKFVR